MEEIVSKLQRTESAVIDRVCLLAFEEIGSSCESLERAIEMYHLSAFDVALIELKYKGFLSKKKSLKESSFDASINSTSSGGRRKSSVARKKTEPNSITTTTNSKDPFKLFGDTDLVDDDKICVNIDFSQFAFRADDDSLQDPQDQSRPKKLANSRITEFMKKEADSLDVLSSHMQSLELSSISATETLSATEVVGVGVGVGVAAAASAFCSSRSSSNKPLHMMLVKAEIDQKISELAQQPTPNIKLTRDQQSVVDAVFKSKQNIMLTGEGGTGKSFLISHIVSLLKADNRKVLHTAMTGTAAVIFNGSTIHSSLQIGLAKKPIEEVTRQAFFKQNAEHLNKIRDLEFLIVDEVSMMNSSFIEYISEYLRRLRRSKLPFGGVRTIFSGDFCQIPPFEGEYCFKSQEWTRANFKVYFLRENMRQHDDPEFAELLSVARWGFRFFSEKHIAILKEMCTTEFSAAVEPTRLFSKNGFANAVNKEYSSQMLKDVSGRILCLPHYQSRDAAIFKNYAESANIPLDLVLFVGARVMITRNIDVSDGLVNGTQGIVVALYSEDKSVDLKILPDRIVHIGYMDASFPVDTTREICYRVLPLRYAWALTIHKSQGMTLNATELEIGSSIFLNGQSYTALSRTKRRKDTRISSLDIRKFTTHPDVLEFYKEFCPFLQSEKRKDFMQVQAKEGDARMQLHVVEI